MFPILLLLFQSFAARAEKSPSAPALAARTASVVGLGSTAGLKLSKMPIYFEANRGQIADASVRFIVRGAGQRGYLTGHEAFLAVTASDQIRLLMPGSKPDWIEGVGPTPGYSNYFIGNDPAKWIRRAPHYEKVRYRNVYPNVDVVYYGNEKQLEFDFVIAPGGDPSQIRLRFEGGRAPQLNASGDILVQHDSGVLVQRRPTVYQEYGGQRIEIAAEYRLDPSGEVALGLGEYDRSSHLIVDPIMQYTSALSGSDDDAAINISVDAQGNAYATGQTRSVDFRRTQPTNVFGFALKQPPAGPFGFTPIDRYDAFAAKVNANGTSFGWISYLGGEYEDSGQAIGADASGNVYVAGRSSSQASSFPFARGFPLAGTGAQGYVGGLYDGFLSKFSPDGANLVYSTMIGTGSDNDVIRGLKVLGNSVYLAGKLGSGYTGASSVRPFGGDQDAVVLRFGLDSPVPTAFTYLGASRVDEAYDIALDGAGSIYIAGTTNSEGLGTTGSAYTAGGCIGRFCYDAFVAKLNASLGVTYYVYLGGSEDETGRSIAVNAAGEAFITGEIKSVNTNAVNTFGANGQGGDTFVARVSNVGAVLNFALFGGANRDFGDAIAADAFGTVYVGGMSASTDFPTSFRYQGRDQVPGTDSFLLRLIPDSNRGFSIAYGTKFYFGGTQTEDLPVGLTGLAIDGAGDVYFVGTTVYANNAQHLLANTQSGPIYQPSAGSEGFIAKLGRAEINNRLVTSYWARTTQPDGLRQPRSFRRVSNLQVSNGAGITAESCQSGATSAAPPGASVVCSGCGAPGATTVVRNIEVGATVDLTYSSTFTSIPGTGPVEGLSFGTSCFTNDPRGEPFRLTEVATNPNDCTLVVRPVTADRTSGNVAITIEAPAGCSWRARSSTASWVSGPESGLQVGSAQINVTLTENNTGLERTTTVPIEGVLGDYTLEIRQSATTRPTGPGLRFVPITPCRIVETRSLYAAPRWTGAFGPPLLAAGATRTIPVTATTNCNIPSSAKVYALNVTLDTLTDNTGPVDFVTIWPTGESRPNVWTARTSTGGYVANSALIKAGTNGSINVYSSNNTNLLLDINGYFTDDSSVPGLLYYPLGPCRAVDTRDVYNSLPPPYGHQRIPSRETRTLRLPGSPTTTPGCNIPSASAYSLQMTLVPGAEQSGGPVAFVTAWPTGQNQPTVSNLNSVFGYSLANSGIVPARSDGSIDVFAFDSTNLIFDVNGYFAPDDNSGRGLSYYPVTQCRVLDTQDAAYTGNYGGPRLTPSSDRVVPLPGSARCLGLPATARAWAVNATVIPNGAPMAFLSLWPDGTPWPVVSQLNAFEGQTVSNSAIVPVSASGGMLIKVNGTTHAALEVYGYFGR